MRGWTSILVGFLLLGLTYVSFALTGMGSSTLLCGVAAAFFFVRGAQGAAAGDAGDPTAVVDFVKNPAGTIVENAVEQFGVLFAAKPKASTEAAEQPAFDADAALARYLAKRGSEPPAVPFAPADLSAPAATAPRGFGRKGVQ